MIAKQFLFPMLQMISAFIPLYLALSIFVPAAPSGNFLPWVTIPLKYLQTALRCPLSTDLQSESKECVGCAQAQLQRQCHSLYHQHCMAMWDPFKSITPVFCQSVPSTYRNSPEDLNAFAKFTVEPIEKLHLCYTSISLKASTQKNLLLKLQVLRTFSPIYKLFSS